MMTFKDGSRAGTLAITPAAEALGLDVAALMRRHLNCDWGDVCDEDRASNDESFAVGSGVHSSYDTPQGTIWIITEADRSVTTILTPDDY